MRTKYDIDKQVEEVNTKLLSLEIKHATLVNRIREVEKTNKEQSKQKTKLKQQKSKKPDTKKTVITSASFNVGDYVQVTNRRNGQFGVVGRIYSVTKAQVHFTDIRVGGGSISRAFNNVKLLNSSKEEKDNLTQSKKHGRKQR